ncbi:hypothetical protein [Paenibacillus phytorum]|uniref:hypothetical protein n=1 Tax=Paenibacillus phytorum TaxID=2654977 RepID=UPI001492778C|nr:hypothetical protein [Paenibacillus phytorum]
MKPTSHASVSVVPVIVAAGFLVYLRMKRCPRTRTIVSHPNLHKVIPFNAIAVLIGGFIAWKIDKTKEKKIKMIKIREREEN